MRRYLIGGSSILFLFILWMIFAGTIDNPYILPGPLLVIKTLFSLLGNHETYLIIGQTFLRLVIAFAISSLLAIILGLFAGRHIYIDDFLHPIVATLRSIPIASVIVIILIIIGHGFSLYIITFLMIFPIIYEATKQGVLNINPDIKQAIAIENHKPLIITYKLHLPLAMPYIRTAMFQSFGLGFKVIVMAEFIAQANRGIGRELFDGSISINYAYVFAWTLIIIILVTIFESTLKSIKKAYEETS